jgi:hypothetical protein
MKSTILTLAVVAAIAATLSLVGCGQAAVAGSPTPPLGKPCTVQFRRDALGAAATLPVPPTTGSFNGAETSISGLLKSSSGERIVLDQHGKKTWVPKSVILLIQFP